MIMLQHFIAASTPSICLEEELDENENAYNYKEFGEKIIFIHYYCKKQQVIDNLW